MPIGLSISLFLSRSPAPSYIGIAGTFFSIRGKLCLRIVNSFGLLSNLRQLFVDNGFAQIGNIQVMNLVQDEDYPEHDPDFHWVAIFIQARVVAVFLSSFDRGPVKIIPPRRSHNATLEDRTIGGDQ